MLTLKLLKKKKYQSQSLGLNVLIMDIGILKKMKRGQILKAFGQLKKEGRHVFHPMVDYYRFKTLKITTPKSTAINVDGENIGSTPLQMQVLPSAIKMIV